MPHSASSSRWYFQYWDCLICIYPPTNAQLSVWYSSNLFQFRSLSSPQTATKQSDPAVGCWYLMQAIKCLNTNAKYWFPSLTICLFPSFSSSNYSFFALVSLEAANLTGEIKTMSSSLFILNPQQLHDTRRCTENLYKAVKHCICKCAIYSIRVAMLMMCQ